MNEPTLEDLERAWNEMERLNATDDFYISLNPTLSQLQLKCYAKKYVVERERDQKQLEDMAQAQQREADYQYKRALRTVEQVMGPTSIYCEATLYGPNTYETDVILYLKDKFSKQYKRHLMMLGGTGAGKTFGAIAYACWHGTPETVAFITAYRMSELVNRRSYTELDALREKHYLIIDDLGVSPEGYKGSDFISYFEDLFTYRHSKNKTTIITSNGTIEDIKKVFGERFVSRFNETGCVYVTQSEDMRAA